MIFPYVCSKCGARREIVAGVGKAPKSPRCDKCKGVCKRVYEAVSVAFKGSGWTTKSSFGEEMKRKNEEAGRRMKGNTPPVRRVATDYGDGDIREV